MIFIGVGSSVGDAVQTFAGAKAWLEARGVKIMTESSLLKNPPMGGIAQNEFTNAVWHISYPETLWEKINWVLLGTQLRQKLKARQLLLLLQRCEKNLGRKRAKRWADRTLDLDILMFHDLDCETFKLIIPHPEIPNRSFVLRPWAEIVDENFSIPRFGALKDLIKNLS